MYTLLILTLNILTYTYTIPILYAGANTLNSNVNILELFNIHILPELHDTDINKRPVVKADVIKLICFFRIHLNRTILLSLIPHIIRYLSSKYVVIQTYAAICIEKFLSIKDSTTTTTTAPTTTHIHTSEQVYRITKADILPQLQPLFTGLFTVLENPELPENDYVMKCILRVMVVLGNDILPVITPVITHITTSLSRVCAKPMNPHFNHYLFECLAVLVKSVCIDTVATQPETAVQSCTNFESLLFPPFQSILTQDITEFIPYVFQVLALLLSARPAGSGLSDAYKSLFPPLLSPILWKQKGYIPALSELFRAYITIGMHDIYTSGHIEGVLGIFQELLSTKIHEVYAFKLLNQLYLYNSIDILSPYLRTIFDLLLRRMGSQMTATIKTPKICRLFIHSILLFTTINGSTALINILTQLSPGLLNELVTNVWTPNRELCCQLELSEILYMIVGGTKLLIDTAMTTDPTQIQLWCSILKNILPLLEAKGMQHIEIDDTAFLTEEAEDREFDTKYSKLIYAHIPDHTPTSVSTEVNQAKLYFSTSLSTLCHTAPGRFLTVIQQSFGPEEVNILQRVIQQYNVTLV